MLFAARWTDHVVHEVCFVMQTIVIKKYIKSIKLARWKEHSRMGIVKEEIEPTNMGRC
jgi:hypothetical protein